jgi:hypothetical protein
MQHQAVLKIDLCHLISTLPRKGTYLLFEMAPSRAILILFMLEILDLPQDKTDNQVLATLAMLMSVYVA